MKKFNELMRAYKEWRETGVEQDEESFTWDCGEASARESFSDFAELEEEITFEEMLKLENNY